MKNLRFLDSYETGNRTVVEIGNDKEKYIGVAYIHPEDVDVQSRFIGGTIAEMRAYRAAIKAELKKQKAERKVISNFIKGCMCCNNFDSSDPAARVVYRQFNMLNKRIKELEEQIKDLDNHIEKIIKASTEEASKIRAFRKNKEN